MDLPDPGERMINKMVLRRDRLIFVTSIPEQNSCSGGGSSWIMEISPRTGSRLSYSPFDLNGDGEFDSEDLTAEGVPASGKRILDSNGNNGGLASTPTVGMCDGKECVFTSTTNGEIDKFTNNSAYNIGRQSWRQLK